jgi:hypothetical protein
MSKAAPKKILTKAVKRDRRAAKPLTLASTLMVRQAAPSSVSQSLGSSSSNMKYGGQDQAIPSIEHDYLTFIAQRADNEWAYVRVNQHCMDVLSTPIVFHHHHAEDMLELWKRVVIDNAIPWEDHIQRDTLRIISYKTRMTDETLSLMGDDENIKDFLRTNAMSKLSDSEARILGLEVLKTKQKMMACGEFHRDDKVLMDRLQANSLMMSMSSKFNHLAAG